MLSLTSRISLLIRRFRERPRFNLKGRLQALPKLKPVLHRFREDPRRQLKNIGRQISHGFSVLLEFLKICFTDGLRAVIDGRYTRRQAAIIMAGTLPAILGTVMIVLPGYLFPSPSHQAFYHFAATLSDDLLSMIPIVLGAASSVLGLKIPLG